VAADEVVKTGLPWTRGKYVLAVVPASRRLDLRLVHESFRPEPSSVAGMHPSPPALRIGHAPDPQHSL
jgi:prolyl-tRNA editing enzyme YbaK/EbsC (Cys-tRNA(Pro) deacylase)